MLGFASQVWCVFVPLEVFERQVAHSNMAKKLQFVKINRFFDRSPADLGWVSLGNNDVWRRGNILGGWSIASPIISFASFVALFMLDRFLCAIWMWVTWTEHLVT